MERQRRKCSKTTARERLLRFQAQRGFAITPRVAEDASFLSGADQAHFVCGLKTAGFVETPAGRAGMQNDGIDAVVTAPGEHDGSSVHVRGQDGDTVRRYRR